MTTLLKIIENLDDIEDSMTICAEKNLEWGKFSRADLCASDRINRDNCFPYFLEISVARDVLLAWSFARNGRIPTLEEKCNALIYFAENDAYIPP